MNKAWRGWKWVVAIVVVLQRMETEGLSPVACGRSQRMNWRGWGARFVLAAILSLTGIVARSQVLLPAPGDINTVAGGGPYVLGGLALNTDLVSPDGVAVDTSGNFYIAEYMENRIDKVTAATGLITVVAGNNGEGSSGDGGAATAAQLYYPTGVAVDAAGNIYIADSGNDRVREVTASNGIITTVAGTGTAGFSGDGGSATSAELNDPLGVAVDGNGNIYIADNGNERIRKVNVSTGTISSVAGNGGVGTNFGSLATETGLWSPEALAVDAAGDVYIAITYHNQIGMVSASTGIITLVAGNGARGFYGDGGSATSAEFAISICAMAGVAVDAAGNVYIGDYANNRIRKVTASTGIITTIAGGGSEEFSGDGGPATSASLHWPIGVAADAEGNVYFADYGNNRIRVVAQNKATPTITWTTPSPSTYGTSLSSTQLDATASVPGTLVYSPSSGTVLGAGTQTLSVSFTPNDTDDYNDASATVSLQVNKVTPTVSVACSPTPITYGGANSICTVYVSDGATGTVSLTINGTSWTTVTLSSGEATAQFSSTYGVGVFTVGATYNGDSNNATAAGSGTVTVNQVSQTITFTPPASPVTYGVAPISLSATGGASGNAVVFSVSSGPCTVSGSTLTVIGAGTCVVPANQAGNADYSAAATVFHSVVVNAAVLTVTANKASRVYGSTNPTFTASFSGFVNGDTSSVLSGAPSLTTTATNTSAPASYSITAAAGTLAASNYTFSFVNGTLTVTAATQTISFTAPPSPVTYGVVPISLSATASSGLAVIFSVFSGPCTVSGNTLTVAGVGTCVVAANQPGNADYTAAVAVLQSVVINKESVIVNGASSVSPSIYGDNVALIFTLTGSGVTPTGTVTISDGANTLATISLDAGIATYNTSALIAGKHTLTAVYSGDNNYQ
jgi:sugar lactone lactonase YvrE